MGSNNLFGVFGALPICPGRGCRDRRPCGRGPGRGPCWDDRGPGRGPGWDDRGPGRGPGWDDRRRNRRCGFCPPDSRRYR